ncbi:MAG TPA: hypothetical protein VFJ72_11790 [Rubrobacteraceae bacterium]|nr:hypothetical protein [Rubrobacteraceae bacterium]
MPSKLIRYGGPAAMLGGVLYIATFGMVYLIYGIFAEQARGTFFGGQEFIYLFYAPMYVFLMLGAVGMYLRQRSYFGLTGRTGFYLTAFGLSLGAIGSAAIVVIGLVSGDEAALAAPIFATHAISHFFYATGSVLLGVATYRAGIFPKEAAVMMGVGPAWQLALFLSGIDQSYLLLLPPFIITALAWTWLGYALVSEKETPVASAPAV